MAKDCPGTHEKIVLRMQPELKELVFRATLRQKTRSQSMGEYVVSVMARHFKRPDLSEVPRRRMGRPPMLSENDARHKVR